MSSVYSFRTTGVDAGGVVSVIALDPAGQRLVAGGDIQGFFISEDYGDRWRVRNRGLWVDSWHRVASVQWSATEANTIYAAVGDLGASGGFMASTDGGANWVRRSSAVQFAGNHTASPLPDGHPRSTGNLIVQGGGYIYAGTYDDGLFRSNDGGFNWTNVGFSGGTHFIRSLAMDPDDPNTIYVALYGEKIWKTTNAAAGTPSWGQLANAPDNPEELKMIGGYVYAACNTAGVFRSADGGAGWDALHGSYLDTVQSRWMSIDGYVNGSNHVIIVGCSEAVEPVAGQGYRSLVKLEVTGGGAVTYTELARDPAAVDLSMPPDDRTWWRDKPTNYRDWPSGNAFSPTCILIDPNNTGRIWVAGSGGVYRSTDGGATWRMVSNGMPLTTNRRVVADPGNPGRIFICNTDWTIIEVSDWYGADAATVTGWAPSSAGTAFDAAVDPVDSTVFMGVGDRDSNIEGEVYSLPQGGTSWTNEGLANADILTPVVSDTFTRTTANGWGSADSGHAWTVVSGPASNLSVNGSAGLMQLAASSASRSIFLQTTSILDCTGTFDVSWDRAAAGTGGHFAAFHVRTDGTTSSSYAFRLDENASGQLTMRVHRIVGTATQIGANPAVTGYTPTATVHVRYRVSGTNPTTLNMSAWVGGTEPGDWMITITDSEATLQDAGPIALRAGGSTGYTAAAICSFDNLDVNELSVAPVSTGGKRPLGVAVGRDDSNSRIILAAVQESGLWRKAAGAWSRVSAVICAGPQTSRAAWFAWAQGSQYVYVFDRATGVYRSADYGQTWSLLWNITSDVGRTGFIALNPVASNELWVSTQTALYKLAGAQSGAVGAGVTAVTLSGVARPGAIAFDPAGIAFCVSLPDDGIDAGLLRSTDGGATWQDVADVSFKAMANRPSDMEIVNGRIYISSLTQGVLIGHAVGQQQVS